MTGLLPGGSLTGLRTLPTPIFPDLTPGFAYQALKLLTLFQSRGRESNWLVPPVHYIIRVIQHLLLCGVVGILVAPFWPSNAFWPFLFASAVGSQPYVIASIYFSDPSRIFALRCYKDSLLYSDRFNNAVLPVRIDARGLRAWRPSGFTLVHEF